MRQNDQGQKNNLWGWITPGYTHTFHDPLSEKTLLCRRFQKDCRCPPLTPNIIIVPSVKNWKRCCSKLWELSPSFRSSSSFQEHWVIIPHWGQSSTNIPTPSQGWNVSHALTTRTWPLPPSWPLPLPKPPIVSKTLLHCVFSSPVTTHKDRGEVCFNYKLRNDVTTFSNSFTPPTAGTTLCENSTLVENGKVVALSRGCIERFGGSGTGGCALSKDDGFLTCICGEDGCNVAFLDTAYDAVVDKKESGGRGGAGLKLHDHQEKTDEDVEGQRPRHGSNKHKHDDGQGGAGRGRVWGWGWPGIALVLIR